MYKPELRIIKNGDGKNSLKRSIAFFGFIILSWGFILTALHGRTQAIVFIYYPLGLVILYAPQLAITLLKIWKGITNDRKRDD